MSGILDRQSFACVAEGMAHYIEQGFKFDDGKNSSRIGLHEDGREVWVRRIGFLDILATVILEYPNDPSTTR